MNQRTLLDRLWSPAGFGLVLLLFLLPFLTVSCGGEQPIESTFTGLDLVIGGAPEMAGPGVDQDVQNEFAVLFAEDLDADVFAILAALAVIAAMAVGLLRGRLARHSVAAGLALVAGCLLTAAVARAPERAENAWREFAESANLLEPITPETHIRYGFWLVLALLATLLVGHVVAILRIARAPALGATVLPASAGPD